MFFVNTEKCWEWSGAKTHGYGVCYLKKNGRQSVNVRVHRFLFELFSGQKLKNTEFACHKCNNRACVNPCHIYKGSAFTNNQDKIKAGTSKTPAVLANIEKLTNLKHKKIIDQNGVIYHSIKDAALKIGIKRNCIGNILTGKAKETRTRNGLKYSFSYFKED